MKYFTRTFRGAWVCVWYKANGDGEAIWVVNVVMCDRVLSMDGVAVLLSESVMADVNRSVDRALQWACEMDESFCCADHSACRSESDDAG